MGQRLLASCIQAFKALRFEKIQRSLALFQRAEGCFPHASKLVVRSIQVGVIAEFTGVETLKTNIQDPRLRQLSNFVGDKFKLHFEIHSRLV